MSLNLRRHASGKSISFQVDAFCGRSLLQWNTLNTGWLCTHKHIEVEVQVHYQEAVSIFIRPSQWTVTFRETPDPETTVVLYQFFIILKFQPRILYRSSFSRISLIFSWTRASFSALVDLGVLYFLDSAFHSSLVFLGPSLSTFLKGSSRIALWASE